MPPSRVKYSSPDSSVLHLKFLPKIPHLFPPLRLGAPHAYGFFPSSVLPPTRLS